MYVVMIPVSAILLLQLVLYLYYCTRLR